MRTRGESSENCTKLVGGVLQEYPLTPLLFNIHIDEQANMLDETPGRDSEWAEYFYAGDVVLMVKPGAGLQRLP